MTLTDVAPNFVFYDGATTPYNGVGAADDIAYAEPSDDGESRDVAGSPVPWQGNEDENGADERDDRQLSPHAEQKWGKSNDCVKAPVLI